VECDTNKGKGTHLASLSHETRNPRRAIKGGYKDDGPKSKNIGMQGCNKGDWPGGKGNFLVNREWGLWQRVRNVAEIAVLAKQLNWRGGTAVKGGEALFNPVRCQRVITTSSS